MEPKKCARCKKSVPRKEHLTCLDCKLTYDIECLNISYNLFQLMIVEKKRNWRCLQCKQNIKKQKMKSNVTPKNNKETLKKAPQMSVPKKCRSSNKKMQTPSPEMIVNNEDLQEPASTHDSPGPSLSASTSNDNSQDYSPVYIDKTLSRSCESIRDLEIVDELKQEISSLREKLVIAENEMENILSENCELQRKVVTLTHEISVLKKICTAPSPSERSLKRQSVSPGASPLKKAAYISQILTLEGNISKLQTQLRKAQDEITYLNNIVEKCRDRIRNEHKNSSRSMNTSKNESSSSNGKKKLCVISATNTLNVTHMLYSDNFYSKFEFCHYIKTNCTAENLIENIESKIMSFTQDDYCVIMIGESDFHRNQNIKNLINIVIDKLNEITNTNVVIAAPTYICGKTLFNKRVELFNNELYRSLLNRENVYFFDTNRNLSLDMFSPISGKLNQKGMRCILSSLTEYLALKQDLFNDTPNNNAYCELRTIDEEKNVDKSQFFLL